MRTARAVSTEARPRGVGFTVATTEKAAPLTARSLRTSLREILIDFVVRPAASRVIAVVLTVLDDSPTRRAVAAPTRRRILAVHAVEQRS